MDPDRYAAALRAAGGDRGSLSDWYTLLMLTNVSENQIIQEKSERHQSTDDLWTQVLSYAEEHLKSADLKTMLATVVAVETLRQTEYIGQSTTPLNAVGAVVELCLRHSDSSKVPNFQDIDRIVFGSQAGEPPTSPSNASTPLKDKIEKCLTSWIPKLPLTTAGASAYRRVLEVLNYLFNRSPSLSTSYLEATMQKLLTYDPYRCSLLQMNIGRKVFHSFVTTFFKKHTNSYLPVEEALQTLKLMASSGNDDELETAMHASVVGWWSCPECDFYIESTSRGMLITYRGWPDKVISTGVLQLATGPAGSSQGVPGCSNPNANPAFSCLIEGFTSTDNTLNRTISVCSNSGMESPRGGGVRRHSSMRGSAISTSFNTNDISSSTDMMLRPVRKYVYIEINPREQNSLSTYIQVDDSDNANNLPKHVICQRDAIASEGRILQMVRVLESILKSAISLRPPSNRLEDDLYVTFTSIPELATAFLKHLTTIGGDLIRNTDDLGSQVPLVNYNTESLAIFFHAACRADERKRRRLFDLYFPRMAESKSFSSLLATVGTILCCGMQSEPKGNQANLIVNLIKKIISNTYHTGVGLDPGSPISILSSLSATYRNEYDGCWSLQCKSDATILLDCIIICGSLVWVNAPTLGSVSYTPLFKYTDHSLVIFLEPRQNRCLELTTTNTSPSLAAKRKSSSRKFNIPIEDPTPWIVVNGLLNGKQCILRREPSRRTTTTPTATPFIGWRFTALQYCSLELETMISTSSSVLLEVLGRTRGRESTVLHAIKLIFKRDGDGTPQDRLMLRLWECCCQQLVSTIAHQNTTVKHLDDYILGPVSEWLSDSSVSEQLFSGSSCDSIQRSAYQIALSAYFDARPLAWNEPPVENKLLSILVDEAYDGAVGFLKASKNAVESLKRRLSSSEIDIQTYEKIAVKNDYRNIHISNGISFSDKSGSGKDTFPDTYKQTLLKIQHIHTMLSFLVESWNVTAAATLQEQIARVLSDHATLQLRVMLSLSETASEKLGIVLDRREVALSYIVTAFFKKRGSVPLDQLSDTLNNIKFEISNIKITDCIAKCFPTDMIDDTADLSNRHAQAEIKLLLDFGCEPKVAEELVLSAIPLSIIPKMLWESFGSLLVNSESPELVLSDDFFTGDEEEILFNTQNLLDQIPLSKASAELRKIYDICTEEGCQSKPLTILKTVLSSPDLIEFTRLSPEAQNAGLSDVLGNSKDIQHAHFQSFVNNITYLNPFVRSTAEYKSGYTNTRQQLHPLKCKEFWAELASALSHEGRESVDVEGICRNIKKLSTKDEIRALEKILRQQHGTIDVLIETCAAPKTIIITLPGTGKPSFECHVSLGSEITVKDGPLYQSLLYRATLQQDISKEKLSKFIAEARDVLRVFSLAAVLFTEGHVEFRSRCIKFPHDKSETLVKLLTPLRKNWGTSVFLKACQEYRELSSITSSQLLRMTDLIRQHCPSSLASDDDFLTQNWRKSRLDERSAVTGVESFEGASSIPDIEAKTTKCIRKGSAPTASTPERHQTLRDSLSSISIDGKLEVSGTYTESLGCYKRVGDNASAYPVSGGWVFYNNSGDKVLTSITTHSDVLRPWEISDWMIKGEPYPSTKKLVRPDARYDDCLTESNDVSTRELNISLTAADLAIPISGRGELHSCVVGQQLYITQVEKYSLWESLGFECGMRIIAINNQRSASEIMKTTFDESLNGTQSVTVTAIRAWLWSVCSPNIITSANAKTAKRVRCSNTSAMALSPALGELFQFKVEGDIQGMRVGIASRSLDVNLPADTGVNKQLAYWYLRSGVIRHGGQDILKARSFHAGDVITVKICVSKTDPSVRLVYFYVNELIATQDGQTVQIPLSRTSETLRPAAYIPSLGGSATLRCGSPYHSISNYSKLTEWSESRNLRCVISADKSSVSRVASVSAPSYCIGENFMTGPGPHRFQVCISGSDDISENVYCGVASPAVPFSVHSSSGKLFALTVRPDGHVFLNDPTKNIHREHNLRPPTNPNKVTLSFTVDIGEGTVEVLRDGVRLLHTGAQAVKFPRAVGPLVPYVVILSGSAVVKLEIPDMSQKTESLGEPNLIVKGAGEDIDGLYKSHSSTYKLSPQVDSKQNSMKLSHGLHLYYWIIKRRWCVSDYAERPLAWSKSNSPSKLSKTVTLWTSLVNPKLETAPSEVIFKKEDASLINFTLLHEGERPTYRSVGSDPELYLKFSSLVGKWLITSDSSSDAVTALYISNCCTVLPHHIDCWLVGNGLQFIEDSRYYVVRSEISNVEVEKASFRFSTTISTVPELMTDEELAGWHIVKLATGVACTPQRLRSAISEISMQTHIGYQLPWETWSTPEIAVSQVSASACHLLQCVGGVFKKIGGGNDTPQPTPSMPDGFRKLKGKSVDSTIADISRLSQIDQTLAILSLFDAGQDRSRSILYCSENTPQEDVSSFLLLHKMSETGLMVIVNSQHLTPLLQNTIRIAAEESKRNSHKQLYAIITNGDGTDETIDHLDYQCCNVEWRKWAMNHASAMSSFASITHFSQPAGSGKSYAIAHMVLANHWDLKKPAPPPVKLDLDSTVNDIATVCKRLLAPLREPTGVLLVNIAHDTVHDILCSVLDGLIFMGKLQSTCGLSVSVPPNAWHLVIEFQEGCDYSDTTVLACTNLSTAGSLLPFNIADVVGATDALQFIRLVLPGMPRDDLMLAHMLAAGERNTDSFREAYSSGTAIQSARTVTRSLKFLARQHRTFNPSASKLNLPMHRLVALCLIHEMHFFVNSLSSDNTHLVLADNRIKMCMQLSGDPSPELQRAMNDHCEDIRFYQLMMKSQSMDRSQSVEKTSFDSTSACSLVNVLANEIAVPPKSVAAIVASRDYVLIPDFLHKLVQLSLHLDLQDPVVLQGPSGTGKTFAVELLCDCMQQPCISNMADAKQRKGFTDLTSTFVKYFVRDPELKKLFPDNQSEVILSGRRVLWGASSRRDTESANNCIAQLVAEEAIDALNYIKDRLFDMVAPLLNGSEEVSQLHSKPDSTFASHISIISNSSTNVNSKEIGNALHSILDQLSTVGAGYLVTYLAHGTEAALKSDGLRDLLGYTPSVYTDFIKILNKNYKLEAFKIWAKEAFKNSRTNKLKFCSMVKRKLREEAEASALCQLDDDLLRELLDGDNSMMTGEHLGDLICEVSQLHRQSAALSVLMRYDMTAKQLFNKLSPTLHRAMTAPDIQFVIIIDEMNATKMLGLMKRIIIDKQWNLWEDLHPESEGLLPTNITILGSVNPADSEREASRSEPGFDVTPLPKALLGYGIPWRQLKSGQRDLFVKRLIAGNKYVYGSDISESVIDLLGKILLVIHDFTEKKSIDKGVRFSVSQRDLHRALKCFSFFCKRGNRFVTATGSHTHDLAISSMLLGAAISYYFRYTQLERVELCAVVSQISNLNLSLEGIVDTAVAHYCDLRHLKLPDAVYAHRSLLQNIFVQIICFELRIAVILEGPPGTSKTLSNSIIRDNMTRSTPFWKRLCSISDVCRYQGTSHSTAAEIHRKCEEAFQKQKENDQAGMHHRRSLLFVDEAGLVKNIDSSNSDEGVKRYPLKTLHYYLEAGLATVLMTNRSLDPAVTNRCVVVHIEEPTEDELTAMCNKMLHSHSEAVLDTKTKKIVSLCCKAFTQLHNSDDAQIRWWFGLRDLFHLMRYIRRRGVTGSSVVTITPSILLAALERNFNGPPDMANTAMRVFTDILSSYEEGYSLKKMMKFRRNPVDILLDSLSDVAQPASDFGNTNSNDTWVRFKLVVDGTDDGSLLQLLQLKNEFNNQCTVLSLSSFTKDELMPATVVSQITAAMESGSTVWLTNTRAIDGSLFDVFNQNYIVTSNSTGEEVFFVAVAMGASLEYKRVHPRFQCLVHVTKQDLTPVELSSPFLNRLEKFYIDIGDVFAHTVSAMDDSEQALAFQLRDRLRKFEDVLSIRTRGLFSDSPKDTIDSLLLRTVRQSGVDSPPCLAGIDIDGRIMSDCGLQRFLSEIGTKDRFQSLWRQLSCKLLQVMQPESMILAQKVLLTGAPAFLRAYFIDLSPCSLTSFCKHICDSTHSESNSQQIIVYSPTTVDFHVLLSTVERVEVCSADSLLLSDRGLDEFRGSIESFLSNKNKDCFCVVISPTSLGSPEAAEIKHELEGYQSAAKGKALLIIQSFRRHTITTKSRCTPLFSNWDVYYIDASAEIQNQNILSYIEPVIAGLQPRDPPEWRHLEQLFDSALGTLMQTQGEGQTRWATVPQSDPAFPLYDQKSSLSEQVVCLKQVLERTPLLRQTLLDLYLERLPKPSELRSMAKEVVSYDSGHVSLAQRLLEEENRAIKALASITIRQLVDTRNASALMNFAVDDPKLKKSDQLLSKILRLQTTAMTFDQLRRHKVNTKRTLVVGPSPPTIPGLLTIVELIKPNPSNSCVAEAQRLAKHYECTPIGEISELIVTNDLQDYLLEDCIKGKIHFKDVDLTKHVVYWVFNLTKAHHSHVFEGKTPTVWSILALCCVDAAVIDNYILAILPLASMGAIKKMASTELDDMIRDHGAMWVSQELGPKLLLEAFPQMSFTSEGIAQFRISCSGVIHRITPTWMNNSDALPCVVILTAVLTSTEVPSVQSLLNFAKACKDIGESNQKSEKRSLPVDLPSLHRMLKANPSATSKVTLELAKICALSKERFNEMMPAVLELIRSKEVTRPMCARIISQAIPSPDSVFSMHGTKLCDWILKAAQIDVPNAKPTIPSCYSPPSSLAGGSSQPDTNSPFDSKIYLALYDTSYDYFMLSDITTGLCKDLILSIQQRVTYENQNKTSQSSIAASLTVKKSAEVAFIKTLAVLFHKPRNLAVGTHWEPSFRSDTTLMQMFSSMAKQLLEQPEPSEVSRKTTPTNSNIRTSSKNKLYPHVQENVMVFIDALESGVGSVRGMGTAAMLAFLRESSNEEGSALVKVCGSCIHLMCKDSEELSVRPGDLPFLYRTSDPLYEPFHRFAALLRQSSDPSSPAESLKKTVEYTRSLKKTLPESKIILIVMYASFRFFFGRKEIHIMSEKLTNQLSRELKLGDRRSRVLLVALDRRKSQAYSNKQVDMTASFMEGFANEWTEMVCTALCVACAYPETFIGSCFLDIDSQRGCFLPGDKTGGPLERGGNYKLDCVTQLDEEGNIVEYSRGQDILSTGACYLLWGVLFSGLAMQVNLFPDAFDTVWHWMISPILKARTLGYQIGTSDYRHLVNQLTERAVAYNLHLGSHTGLTVDEARKLYALFLYSLVSTPGALETKQHRSRGSALLAEASAEEFWKLYTSTHRKTLSRSESELCSTLRSLLTWRDGHYLDLPRPDTLFPRLECLPSSKSPRLVSMMVYDKKKLVILAPLIIDLCNFVELVQRCLSNRLPLKQLVNGEEQFTAYCGVLQLLKEHAPGKDYRMAKTLLLSIKHSWNQYANTVGPIDYECQEGGINILMDTEDLPDDVDGSDCNRIGSAGLPDTLDFWITTTASTDSNHRNLVKEAIHSLIDKYNKCQSVVEAHTRFTMEDVDPSILNPSKPDLILRECNNVVEIYRSHAQASGHVNWDAIESEIALSSGLILPKMLLPILTCFSFTNIGSHSGTCDAEHLAIELLDTHVDRFSTPLSDSSLQALRDGVREFSEERTTETLACLAQMFNRCTVVDTNEFFDVFSQFWRVGNVSKQVPISEQSLKEVEVRHTAAVMKLFLEKIEFCDWLLPHISGYAGRISADQMAAIEERTETYLRDTTPEKALEELSSVIEVACDLVTSGMKLTEDQELTSLIAGILMDGESSLCMRVYHPIHVKNLASFIREAKLLHRRLHALTASKSWVEETAIISELPYLLKSSDDVTVTDRLIVKSSKSDQISPGMKIASVGRRRVTNKKEYTQLIDKVEGNIEIGIFIRDGE